MAPLHNPANLTGVEVAEKVFPEAAQIAVFDTAFHQTMPEVAFRYAIPTKLYERNGNSANMDSTVLLTNMFQKKPLEYLGKKEAKVITIHIGNGASMAAVKNGVCVDTTMGMGPLKRTNYGYTFRRHRSFNCFLFD